MIKKHNQKTKDRTKNNVRDELNSIINSIETEYIYIYTILLERKKSINFFFLVQISQTTFNIHGLGGWYSHLHVATSHQKLCGFTSFFLSTTITYTYHQHFSLAFGSPFQSILQIIK